MRKTTLDLDSLEVTTFATSSRAAGFGEEEDLSWWPIPSTRSCVRD